MNGSQGWVRSKVYQEFICAYSRVITDVFRWRLFLFRPLVCVAGVSEAAVAGGAWLVPVM